jgi:hypothetical protein
VARASESIFIPDFDKLIKELKAMSPALRKDFNKGLTEAVKPMTQLARTFVPGSVQYKGREVFAAQPPDYSSPAWINDKIHRSRDPLRWTWQPAIVARGIKVKRTTMNKVPYGYNKVAVAALALVNSTPGGAIYELAGAGSKSSQARTKSVSRNYKAQDDFKIFFPKVAAAPRRLIYKAEAVLGDKVRTEIAKIIDERLYKFIRGAK